MKQSTIDYILELLREERSELENPIFNGRTSQQARDWQQQIDDDLKEIDDVTSDFKENTETTQSEK